ncbi:ATP-binding cassette domain-containing protein [Microbacterium sp. W4I20]|uniref:ATP-binding cassette domain-containing protein n=1 Tax=Microbacterium sp. W4I20 TaxID=3042262 RepID=UPI002780640E|nr:ATP-binding cassette domain-containing protein [Microbacterium sp. W4I20]MDQ0728097.1 ABC-2 type transport system ATP-binding protein [Microbacterium sp. W4I20]
MPDGQVLEFTNVTKRFNEVTAVSDFSARVEPGAVTAFLGPNGAGKTTTLRILLGQVRATSGTATIGGTAFAELRQPLRTIGSVLEETAYRPRRTANRQLTIAAKANGIPLARVDEVLAQVGLGSEADSRIGGFSLGMRQRLSVANALLGDPGALVFDEPANGLDPEGIRWMRLLMRRLADEGRTVLVSSHLLSEIEQVADNVLVLSKGKLVLASGIETLADPKAGSVVVDAADRAALTVALTTAGFDVEVLRSGLTVRGGDAGTVGAVAAEAGIALSTLVQRGPTLEDVFIDLVRGGKFAPRSEGAAQQVVVPRDAEAAEADAGTVAGAAGVTAALAGAAGVPGVVGESETADAADEGSVDDGSVAEEAAAEGAVAEDAAEGATVEVNSEETDADAGENVVDENGIDENGVDDNSAEENGIDENGVDDNSAEENGVDENGVDADSVDESAAADELGATASGDDETATDTATDQTQDEQSDAPVRSFDEILFGAAAPAPAASPTEDAAGENRHDVAEVFATPEQGEAAGEVSSEAESGDSADAESETSESSEEPVGVEFFAELGQGEAAEDAASVDATTQDGATDSAADGDGENHAAQGEDDPRSAAVSTMLAAAARAYYEDEPKDYPLGEAATDDAAGDDGAQWSVASTGVIDTVPLAAESESESSGDEGSDEGAGEEPSVAEDQASGEGEHHEGDRHEGEHQHGEHHGDEHHHG